MQRRLQQQQKQQEKKNAAISVLEYIYNELRRFHGISVQWSELYIYIVYLYLELNRLNSNKFKIQLQFIINPFKSCIPR